MSQDLQRMLMSSGGGLNKCSNLLVSRMYGENRFLFSIDVSGVLNKDLKLKVWVRSTTGIRFE